MRLNVLRNREADYSGESCHVPLKPRLPAASLIRHQWSRLEIKPLPGAGMPWGVFAAFVVALASTGFLFVMALTRGIYVD
jgi:hypothetical protein